MGGNPVSFAEALAGPCLPHLIYMPTCNGLAERDRVWSGIRF